MDVAVFSRVDQADKNMETNVTSAKNSISSEITTLKNSITNEVQKGVIKSVQRGLLTNINKIDHEISITSVNLSKSLLFIDAQGGGIGGTSGASGVLRANSISIATERSNNAYPKSISWQVVEFI